VAVVLGTAGLARGDADQMIRVGLHYGSSAVGSAVVRGEGAGRGERSRGGFDGEVVVRADRGEVVLDHKGRRLGVGRWVELEPAPGRGPLTLDGSAYRGSLRFEARGGRLWVINVLPVEDYVRGVVPNEMFEHGEAYKVQAVISRTIALYIRDIERKHRGDGFDICGTGHCQVYRGAGSERRSSDKAVAATNGEVLTYRGRPIFSAYHANAGGVTQPVDEAWPGSVRDNFPYLQRVESPYDAEASGLPGYAWCYRWRREVPLADILDRLPHGRGRLGSVRDVTVRSRTSTERVRELAVRGTRGRVVVERPSEIRSLLQVPSARFDLERRGRYLSVVGWGRGHGVGLSQHGALGMAKAGYSYRDILGHFYRGVHLAESYGGGDSTALSAPELRRRAPTQDAVEVPAGTS
jgi:stage II sporulation protein D